MLRCTVARFSVYDSVMLRFLMFELGNRMQCDTALNQLRSIDSIRQFCAISDVEFNRSRLGKLC